MMSKIYGVALLRRRTTEHRALQFRVKPLHEKNERHGMAS